MTREVIILYILGNHSILKLTRIYKPINPFVILYLNITEPI